MAPLSSVAKATIQRSVVAISNGMLTEVLTIPAAGQATLQVCVVPGNPGNAHYYRSLMRMLHAAFDGRAEIIACSHPGHELGPQNTGRQLWSIEDQVNHKAMFIREHLLLPGRPPLMILAHSIGSYMSVRAVDQLCAHATASRRSWHPSPQSPLAGPPHLAIDMERGMVPAVMSCSAVPAPDPWISVAPGNQQSQQQGMALSPATPDIVKVVALMPFLQADFPTQREQRFLRMLSKRYRIMAFLGRVLSVLPLVVRMALVNWWTGGTMTPSAVRTTCELLHPHTLLNNFYMAHTEFHQLDAPFDWSVLRRLGPRLHVVACPRDPWMSEAQLEALRTAAPEVSTSWHPDLEHAFCVFDAQCAAVAQLAAQLAAPFHRTATQQRDSGVKTGYVAALVGEDELPSSPVGASVSLSSGDSEEEGVQPVAAAGVEGGDAAQEGGTAGPIRSRF